MIDEGAFTDIAEAVAQAIDLAGIAVIVVGLVFATALYLRAASERSTAGYHDFRQRIGKAILLGLEFLVAADIIRTVAVSPTFRGVGVLAVIVAVRTFLSFALEVELNGRWPWQGARSG
ncbi:MAG: DUF1622 domain-containing protein [Thermoleophilaceae bacterium]